MVVETNYMFSAYTDIPEESAWTQEDSVPFACSVEKEIAIEMTVTPGNTVQLLEACHKVVCGLPWPLPSPGRGRD